MKCDLCKKNEATLHVKQVSEGSMRALSLCETCAREKGLNDPSPLALTNLLLGIGASLASRDASSPRKCPGCGTRITEFKKGVRMGCATCYEIFAEELKPILRRMHPGSQHVGKVPASEQTNAELAELQKALAQAVAVQNFEEAARLRDRMYALRASAECPRPNRTAEELSGISSGPGTPDQNPESVAISSRVRLARNLKGVPFPNRASPRIRRELWDRITQAIGRLPLMRGAVPLPMAALNRIDREILWERHVISRELVDKEENCGVVVSSDERVSILVNEEDHLRLQAIQPGIGLRALWSLLNTLDSEIEPLLPYAFSPSLGYLTACPSNAGTGMRASVMVHLPGLRLLNELEPTLRGLERLGVVVRGMQGEGSDAMGDLFQLSNAGTLGLTENTVLERLEKVVAEVVRHEQNARQRLLEQRRVYLLDYVARAYALLTHAHVLTSREAADMLSALRLGLSYDLIRNLTASEIQSMITRMQPGHIQRSMGRLMPSEQRDAIRARLLGEWLKRIRLAAGARRRRLRRPRGAKVVS